MTITDAMPDYLPARMLNEYTYCPRLFYYEHVESVFAENLETVEGSMGHKRVDKEAQELPTPDELAERDGPIQSRSVTLSSDNHKAIAKMDLLQCDGREVIPVDYKRGKPPNNDDGSLDAWDTDKTQLCVQALILRDNGYQCIEAIAYYMTTRQRVRIAIDEALVAKTEAIIRQARVVAASDQIPPPLVDSPKCPRCSLVGICLPDETTFCRAIDSSDDATESTDSSGKIRRLLPARDDLRPLYLNTQGLHVGKSGGVLKIKEKGKVVQEVRINDICQLNLFGNIQITTQAIQALCAAEKPIVYFSSGGWFYGATYGLGMKNIFLRREQFRQADDSGFCLKLAQQLVVGKIRNQRTMLQRNHIEPPKTALAQIKCMQDDAPLAKTISELLGIEGNAARVYFQNFSGMIKVSEDEGKDSTSDSFAFDFSGRNRRPPRDPVNALLSLAYSVLAKDLAIACHTVGFDPYLGLFHQPRFGRASLALDLMEPFRSLIADSSVLWAINTRMITTKHFISAGQSVALTSDGRKAFFRAYEQRMDTLVTHPLFGYRVNYRRLLEIQVRLLARLLTGEIDSYPVFTTR